MLAYAKTFAFMELSRKSVHFDAKQIIEFCNYIVTEIIKKPCKSNVYKANLVAGTGLEPVTFGL
jgi:hypothetical protein